MRMRAGYPEMLTCTLTWGLVGTIVRQLDLDAPMIVFARLTLGFLVVAGWAVATGRGAALLRPGPRGGLLVAAGAILGVHWLLLFEAYLSIGVVPTILIVFVAPVLWAAASPWLVGERGRLATMAAVLLAFAGLALITLPNVGSLAPRGVLAALGSAVLFAGLILLSKVLTRTHEPVTIAVWQLAVAAVLVAPTAVETPLEQVVRALPGLLVLGVVMTGVLYILFFRAVRSLGTQQLGVLFYLEPAAAVFYAWWLAGEQPTSLTLVGGALVIGAGVWTVLADAGSDVPGPERVAA